MLLEEMSLEELIDVIQCAYYDTQDRRATPHRRIQDNHLHIRFSVAPDAPKFDADRFVAELAERGLEATVKNCTWAVELTGQAAAFTYTINVQRHAK